MRDELAQCPAWRRLGTWWVSGELFLDIVFTSACDCACPWCIVRTREYAREDREVDTIAEAIVRIVRQHAGLAAAAPPVAVGPAQDRDMARLISW